MATAPLSVPSVDVPRPASLKAPATTSAVTEADNTAGPPRTASPLPRRRAARPLSSDYLSDKATAALIRRTLCAQHLADRGRSTPAPIQDLLPPLTSRNDVDLQLYALISIIIREFVQNWYARITPDETFVTEIVQIIAHCTRALEQRLRKVDLESLLFDELPELFDAHVRAYRSAKNAVARPPVKVDSREAYHALSPLPGLSPVPRSGEPGSIAAQAANESEYRQLLVQGVLAVLLPTEDLENKCLTALVGQIFSELILGNLVANKLSEPWLIWEILIILSRQSSKKRKRNGPDVDSAEGSALGARAADQQTWSCNRAFWALIQWAFLAVSSIRLLVATFMFSRSLPPRVTPTVVRPVKSKYDGPEKAKYSPATHESLSADPMKAPIADFRLWPCIGNLLELDARMPWLRGALSLLQWGAMEGPGKIAGFNGSLDRLLSHYIDVLVLDPAHLPPLLRTVRASLFPNNAPGSPSLVAPSSEEQLAALRRRCASALRALVPTGVARLYFGAGNRWPWESADAPSVARGSGRNADSRSGTLDSNSSTHASKIGEKPPRAPLTDEVKPEVHGGATLDPTESTRQSPLKAGRAPSGDEDDSQSDAGPGTQEGDEDRILSEIEEGILDVFSDAYCNKHLVYGIVELVLVRLIPELADRNVCDLWEERLS
ncbi:PXA domain-containing protein [Xylariaceae sp. FL0804]|nr:PXA domain-containing protein [Xylariaceae sp. FL0804]